MAIFLMILAGGVTSIGNLFMRKSIDQGGTTKGYLIFQMGMAFFVALLLNPIQTGNYSINVPIIGLGAISGVILSLLLFFLGRSLETGPSGLTFSFLNTSTVMPGIIMAFLFGQAYGFPYTVWSALGSIIVILGLFMANASLENGHNFRKWACFCFAMFVLHVLLLVLFQWRALLLKSTAIEEITSLFSLEQIQSPWYTPLMFLFGILVQIGIFSAYERRKPTSLEMGYGLIGGIMNGLCTYFMIWATEVASPFENALIYPIFSVMVILLSNLWSQRLYAEKVNWRACQVCLGGLVVGLVDWKTVGMLIGFVK